MIALEDIKKYLPQYLSDSSKNSLFEDLKHFPDNCDNLYSNKIWEKKIVFQGDGLAELPMINLPSIEVRNENGIVLSNTCDIDPMNDRKIEPRMVYAPILNLTKYENMLKQKGVPEQELLDHIRSIKKQRISHFLYLPKGQNLKDDSIALLDRLNNFRIIGDQKTISNIKLFSLSNYGFYVFLIKLSIHFMRIREDFDRN